MAKNILAMKKMLRKIKCLQIIFIHEYVSTLIDFLTKSQITNLITLYSSHRNRIIVSFILPFRSTIFGSLLIIKIMMFLRFNVPIIGISRALITIIKNL